MNKLLDAFLNGLRDRIVGSVASLIGSTFSTFRAAQEAEQQSFLEDLARRYEAEGKQALAEQLRSRARHLCIDDPAGEAQAVIHNVLNDSHSLPAPPHDPSQSENTSGNRSPERQLTKPRRKKTTTPPVADSTISLD